MQRCLQLAANGMGHTRSNPMVGCVVVHNEKIISEGYHEKYGGPHAEVNALKNITDPVVLKNCTVYVNLEPCSHHGKTPPCADLLVSKGIKKVVIASVDPNPLVAGKGIEKLRAAGVEVVAGVLDKENRELNKRFFTFYEKKRPYIVLKWAQSSDKFLSPEDHQGQFKLTGHQSNILVHKWRAVEMGILAGRRTIEQDDPQLDVRHVEGVNPVRIIIDPLNKIQGDKNIFNGAAHTLVYTRQFSNIKDNVEHIAVGQNDLPEEILRDLYQRNIISVLVEGGAFTLSQFINRQLWDEARIFTCEAQLGKGVRAPGINGKQVHRSKIDRDELTILYRI